MKQTDGSRSGHSGSGWKVINTEDKVTSPRDNIRGPNLQIYKNKIKNIQFPKIRKPQYLEIKSQISNVPRQ